MSKILHTEQSVGETSQELTLIVNEKNIKSLISNLERKYKKFVDNLPQNTITNQKFTLSLTGEPKTRETVIWQMQEDLELFKHYGQGLAYSTLIEKTIAQIKAEIHNEKHTIIEWGYFFSKIPKKRDGTFIIGRVTQITKAFGFSWVEKEMFARKGYEMIIKTLSSTQAILVIRVGIIERFNNK
jgi:hypothetical protein